MPGPKKNKPKTKKKPLRPQNPNDVQPHVSENAHDDAATAATTAPEDHAPLCIEHQWNGPRVIDVDKFLGSSHAAAPATSDDDVGDTGTECAAYTRPGVKEMFVTVLPRDTALILWYNKSRQSARICPACRRFYAVRDILLPHLLDDRTRAEYVDPRNLREKQISGLCSLMCFGIASYNWPGCIGAWGKLAAEIDATTQGVLCGPGANIADDGMGVLMKLSRLDGERLLGTVQAAYSAGERLY